jgi:predicted RNase H-like HicB family nuclease
VLTEENGVRGLIEQIAFSGWIYITRAEDIEGCWVAHCVDFNIISQGDSPQQALEMVREALGMTLADDLNRGLDPNKRRNEVTAEDWQPLLKLFEKHTRVPVDQMDVTAGNFREFAVPTTMMFARAVDAPMNAPVVPQVVAKDVQQFAPAA